MKKYVLFRVLTLFVIILIAACTNGENKEKETGTGEEQVIEKEKDKENDIDPSLIIAEGFNFENFPKIDGSTSTEPLNMILVCKLLGIKYEWLEGSYRRWYVEPVIKNVVNSMKFWRLIKTSQTHQSFINLIDKEADIILTARKMSPDEKTYADEKGVTLIETPVALDAFIFIVNPDNPIESLTITQIQDIYSGNITSWGEVGWNRIIMGNDYTPLIKPYVRNENSGSQELMETLVMKNLNMADLLVNYFELIVFNMSGAVDIVFEEDNAICYTVYYYKEYIAKGIYVKTIAINGIHPNKETIANKTYPLNAEVYAVIRSDLDQESTAYKLYELLQSETGKKIIEESGYVPY